MGAGAKFKDDCRKTFELDRSREVLHDGIKHLRAHAGLPNTLACRWPARTPMDSTPTALFDSYELDFRHILDGIRDKLEASSGGAGASSQCPRPRPPESTTPAEQQRAALRKVELELDEADDIVSALEIETHGIPQSIKAPYAARLKNAKAELARYRGLARDGHAQQARADLLARSGAGGSDDPYGGLGDPERARLLGATQTLEGSGRRLRDTQRVALEAEEQGADILRTLRGQRETIETARDTVSRGG
ncbi:hypothetical protein C0993_000811 [Termitomyces sp. T159_Od127]|nr:hypothetical protein C0993_000811 [Termitomyces sp. T159_Od127]